MKRTVMPVKIAMKWIENQREVRRFIRWMYDNGFEILVTSDDVINRELGKELDEYYEKQPGVRTEW